MYRESRSSKRSFLVAHKRHSDVLNFGLVSGDESGQTVTKVHTFVWLLGAVKVHVDFTL